MCLTTGYQVTKKLRFITIQAIGKEKHGLKVNQRKLVVRYQQPVCTLLPPRPAIPETILPMFCIQLKLLQRKVSVKY